ncbi:hypothetical protein GGI43DRAFT_146819 [Trichoderma evansii]
MPLRANANLWGHLFLQIRNLLGFMGWPQFILSTAVNRPQPQAPSFPSNEEDTLSAQTGALICGLLYSDDTGINMYFVCCYCLCCRVPDAD